MNLNWSNFFLTVIIAATPSKGQDYSSNKENEDDETNMSVELIIGIISGILGIFILCGIIVFIILKYKHRAANEGHFQEVISEDALPTAQGSQNNLVYLESEASLINREGETQRINNEIQESWNNLNREIPQENENLQAEENIPQEIDRPQEIESPAPLVNTEKKSLLKVEKGKKTKEKPECKEYSIAHQKTCTICLDDFKIGEFLKKTKCNHLFHVKCLDSWAIANANLQLACPVCREDILKKS